MDLTLSVHFNMSDTLPMIPDLSKFTDGKVEKISMENFLPTLILGRICNGKR